MRRDPLGADRDPDEGRSALPDRLGDALAGFAEKRGWRERLRGARVHEVWVEAAGAELARHVRPVRLHGGILVVEAASAAWATQVRYLAGDLARRVNEVLGGQRVRQVRVVVAKSAR